MKFRQLGALVVTAAILTGCYTIGRDFTRPRFDQFELRQTTQGQVLAAVGTPASVSHTEKNGHRIERFQYSYFSSVGFAAGVGPVGRMASLYFTNGQLIGYLYTSSFPGESTDFNLDNASRIEKGTSTRADVEALLGKPHGVVLFPMVDGEGNSQIRYFYYGATGLMGTEGTVTKDLLITLNDKNVVTDLVKGYETKK
jgi:hypothetical protein